MRRVCVILAVLGVLAVAAPAAASTGWSVQKTPNPAANGNTLSAVACRADTCTAVGHYHKKTAQYGQIPVTLTERWNGTAWAIQPGPHPGAQGSSLAGVACPSARSCFAVGYYIAKSGVTRTLAEHWNGTAWATQASPNPALDITAAFTGVSCSSASACTAVGWYISDANGTTAALVEHWNGARWALQATPVVAGSAELAAVSCPALAACTAVGDVIAGSGTPLAEHWDGTRWAVLPTPPSPPGPTGPQLTGVSCPAARTCTAVGWYSTGAPVELALAERWDGSTWSLQPVPDPAGATDTILEAVSCPSGAACTAVGVSDARAVAEAWDRATWALEPVPIPAKAQGTELSGVACTAAATCTAVGHWNYNGLNAVGQTLAEHK